MRALVVDDSKAMRTILGRMLKELGFEILGAGNGQDALETLEAEGVPELMLVDWNMPVMNGLDFVKSVRAIDSYASSKIMMVTTETDASNMTSALEAGADEYVMKPFTKEVIGGKLAMLGIEGLTAP